MEPGFENNGQGTNNQPLAQPVQQNARVTSNELFDKLTQDDFTPRPVMTDPTQQGLVSGGAPAVKPEEKKEGDAAEHPISSENQLDKELEAKKLENERLAREKLAQQGQQPQDQPPAYLKADLFETKEKQPQDTDWKREYEKTKAQLDELALREDDFIRNYAKLKQVPGFDFNKFIRDYVAEDFSTLTLDQKYEKFLDGIPNITEEQKKLELARLEDMTFLDRQDFDRRITGELQQKHKPVSTYASTIEADLKKHEDAQVRQQQVEEIATTELTEFSRSVVGRTLGGLEITDQMAKKAVDSLYNPASAIAFFNEDGTYDTKRMLRTALIEQNFESILLKTVEKARADFFRERGNPSFVAGNNVNAPIVNDPDGQKVNDFLAEEGLRPKRL